MEKDIFRYIISYSKKQQITLLFLAIVSFPFLYLSLDIPKTIINKAIGGSQFPQEVLGLGLALEQTPYLLTLCFLFLALVLINGGFKYYINVYRGVIGERMLRRLRYQLIERVMRFPLPHFRNVSQGEIVSMVTAETEPLGGFTGDAFSLPSFQGGILLTYIAFIFIQDPYMGAAAIALYPVQAYLIPKLQMQVNRLGKERVQNVRKLSERLGEMVSGAPDIHAHDTAHYELADFSDRLGSIFDIRFQIYRKKFFIKFLNNFLAQLTPFFFFSIGGYLVIAGNLTLGALVAVLAAYKDLAGPWKELLAYYQRMEDARIKYDQLKEQFQPMGMLEESLLEPQRDAPDDLGGVLNASNLSFEMDDGNKIIEGASFSIDLSDHVAIVGSGGADKTVVAQLIARQITPTGGKISIGETNLASMPDAVTGRAIAYVDQESYIRSGSIMDALMYGLKHHPTGEAETGDEEQEARQRKSQEAALCGNSPFSIDDEWVDYESIGVAGHGELVDRAIHVLGVVGLGDDVFQNGLQSIINPQDYPQLAEGVLKARAVIGGKLADSDLTDLVEIFDEKKFNTNASIAENILFGTPVDDTFRIDSLGENARVLEALEKAGLSEDFLNIGRSIAALMVELFQDLPPGHEFFERFSFFDSDDLPEFQRIVNLAAANDLKAIDEPDRNKLTDLTFKLVLARHHLDLIDHDMQERILDARRLFSKTLPEDQRHSIAFFDVNAYNPAISIQDNILFGKVAASNPESVARIGEILTDAIGDLSLRKAVLEVGLEFQVGVAGKRLTAAQRQKLSIARCLLKRPKLMIVNQAAASLDATSKAQIFDNIKSEMKDGGLIWVDTEINGDKQFDRVLEVEIGKVAERTKDGDDRKKPPPEIAAKPGEPASADSELLRETELLAGIPFFSGMDRSKLKLLAFTSERLTLEAGQVLFWQGSIGETAHVIASGTMEVNVDTPEGPKTLATPGRGGLIGELALLCDAPRSATVLAKNEVTLLSISKDVFLKLVVEDSKLSANLTRIIADKLVDTTRQISTGLILYDDITGLPNRKLFADRLKHVINYEKRAGQFSALIMLDLEELERLGDGNGEDTKNTALNEAVQRLVKCLREADTLARINDGYKFVIIASGTTKEVDTVVLKQRLVNVMKPPFTVGDKSVHLDKGLDFAIYPLIEENLHVAEELM